MTISHESSCSNPVAAAGCRWFFCEWFDGLSNKSSRFFERELVVVDDEHARMARTTVVFVKDAEHAR